MRRIACQLGLLVLIFAPPVLGQAEVDPPTAIDDDLGVVPLIDNAAPTVALWFISNPAIGAEDAMAISSQLIDDFSRRTDIRLMPRLKARYKVEDKAPDLLACPGADLCLVQIAYTLELQRIIAVQVEREDEQTRVDLTSIVLAHPTAVKQTARIEGSVDDLLTSGCADVVRALLDDKGSGHAVDAEAAAFVAGRQPPPLEEVTAPPPAPEALKKPAPAPRVRVVEVRPEQAPTIEERPSFFRRHLGSTLSMGLAVAAGSTALGLGLTSANIQSDLEAPGAVWDEAEDQRGRDFALGANVLMGVAGAAVVTAVVLFIIED